MSHLARAENMAAIALQALLTLHGGGLAHVRTADGGESFAGLEARLKALAPSGCLIQAVSARPSGLRPGNRFDCRVGLRVWVAARSYRGGGGHATRHGDDFAPGVYTLLDAVQTNLIAFGFEPGLQRSEGSRPEMAIWSQEFSYTFYAGE